jgi:SAM-dependent methyltransferase
MVRTVRSVEEEARVHRVSGPGLDAFLADESRTELLEGRMLGEVLAWAHDGARRALIVGLEDRGRIALDLAKAGVFVTVVEPDVSLHGPLMAQAEAARCSIRLTIFASDYMKREFSTSGFDLAIFFATLGRYNEPMILLKKAARELRAGGRVFARLRVRPPLGGLARLVGRLPRGADVIRKAGEWSARVPGLAAVLALPDADSLLEAVGEVFKIEKAERYHLVAPVLGWLSIQPRMPARELLGKAIPAAARLDDKALRLKAMAPFATHVAFYGSKELGLGKTFRV